MRGFLNENWQFRVALKIPTGSFMLGCLVRNILINDFSNTCIGKRFQSGSMLSHKIKNQSNSPFLVSECKEVVTIVQILAILFNYFLNT